MKRNVKFFEDKLKKWSNLDIFFASFSKENIFLPFVELKISLLEVKRDFQGFPPLNYLEIMKV